MANAAAQLELTMSSSETQHVRAGSDMLGFAVMTHVRGDAERLERFLRDHGLGSLIVDGRDAARRAFGVHCRGFALEMYDDPDGGDDSRLFVLVRVDTDVPRGVELEESFDNEWWLDHMGEARGKLAFALEFV